MNNAIKIYRSNKVEILFAILSEVVGEPLASPFAPECIMVQSKGMATWLSMQLSRRFGVWANPDFPHPRQFVQRILRATLGEEGDLIQRFSRERLAFALLDLFPRLGASQEFSPLVRYLEDSSPVKRLQLARQLANTFDQYVVFRPQMVLAWEEGDDTCLGRELGEEAWQPVLWRLLVERLGCCSPARLMLRAHANLQGGLVVAPGILPSRISIFGIVSLPQIYLQMLAALGKSIPVHLYQLSPSEHYWGDIESKKKLSRQLARGEGPHSPLDFSSAIGHPLLASMGILARDFQHILESSVAYELAQDVYIDHEQPMSMLQMLQHDMLHLNCRSYDSPLPPVPLAADDDSITIHACYSRLREVEVLQDRLLALFAEHEELEPRDVLVMLPDVSKYAPLVDAVFGRSSQDPRFIPYRIADRPMLGSMEVIDAFFSVLALLPGRFYASQVVDLLGCTIIQQRFGFCANDMELIRTWVAQSGIRWAVDEEQRQGFEQPRDRQNTWHFGFDRLLMGYATFSNGRFVGDILPCDLIEGQHADLFGRFMQFCETLFAYGADSRLARTLAGWQDFVQGLISGLFAEDSAQAWQLQKIRDAVAAMAAEADETDFHHVLDFGQMIILLQEKLSRVSNEQGFLEGGLTFCSMLPMRTVPFRVVCLLGMNENEVPQIEHPSGFDLLSRFPQAGDRSKRNDDRYLFLEALLAARQQLMLFYVGHSGKDGSELPPSVLVDELLDLMAETFACPEAEEEDSSVDNRQSLAQRLVVRHPLQPFSPRYFDGTDQRLFSYAEGFCRAARSKADGSSRERALLSAPLPLGEEFATQISLADLQRFFNHPVRNFFQNRLQVFLDERLTEVHDREPVVLDNLDLYQLGSSMLDLTFKEQTEGAGVLQHWQGAGEIPLGGAGIAVWRETAKAIQSMVSGLRTFQPHMRLAPFSATIILGSGACIAGELNNRYPQGLLLYAFSKLNGRILLEAWVAHLFLCAAAPPDQERHTHLVCRDENKSVQHLVFKPCEDACRKLDELVRLRNHGLCEPLLFFPKSSYLLVEALGGEGGSPVVQDRARQKAMEAFCGKSSNSFPEGKDPYYELLFQGGCPMEPGYSFYEDGQPRYDFAELAQAVFAPLLAHIEVM